MPATCVPCYVLCGQAGLSKHGHPVFLHFCPLNQNLACVRTSTKCQGSDEQLTSSRSRTAIQLR